MDKRRQATFDPRRPLAVAALVALNLALVPAGRGIAHSHVTPTVTIAPGQADLRRYSREPGTVIVGDAEVAAASIATSQVLVLTGLQPGETNVFVLDDTGAEIEHIALRVVTPGTTVVLRRGQERQLLQCDPICAPIDEPGVASPAPQGAAVPAHESAPPT